jgi:hypothetical protein
MGKAKSFPFSKVMEQLIWGDVLELESVTVLPEVTVHFDPTLQGLQQDAAATQ